MYNVYNASEVIYLKDLRNGYTRLIGSENDLIHLLAKEYRNTSWDNWIDWGHKYFDKFLCLEKDYCYCGPYIVGDEWLFDYKDKYYLFFDGAGRHINPMLYRKEAWNLYLRKYKGTKDKTWWDYPMTTGKDFRNGLPIKGIHKRKYHRSKMPKHKQRLLIQSIKEYQEFNRGDKIDSWYIYHWNKNQKSWKKQSKSRHQWKPKNLIDN